MLYVQSSAATHLLRIAKDLIAQGEIERAYALLQSIAELYPDDEAAEDAAVLLRLFNR